MNAQSAAVIADRDVVRAKAREVLLAGREALRAAKDLNPAGGFAEKVGVVLLDLDSFEDRVLEFGGEQGFLFMLSAQVANGVSLTVFCEHYAMNRGVLWAWLTEDEARVGRYYLALRGIADRLVGEVSQIADTPQMGETRKVKADGSEEVTEEDMLGHRKLRVDTYLRLAEKYDAPRFGRQTKVTHEVGGDFGERLRRAQERVIDVVPEIEQEPPLVVDEPTVVEVVTDIPGAPVIVTTPAKRVFGERDFI